MFAFCTVLKDVIVSLNQDLRFSGGKDKDKVPDLSVLPPCNSSLQKHIQRANYVDRIWRKAEDPIMMLEDQARHGWLPDLSTDWMQEAYPDDVAEQLISTDDTNETSEFDR